MEEKIKELLSGYNLEVRRLYRGRGAWLCDTDRGLKLFKSYMNSPSHLTWEVIVKETLIDRGYVYIDNFLPNKEGSYIIEDDEQQKYILCNWYEGRECSTRDREEIIRAAAHMAWMHKGMKQISVCGEFFKVYMKNNVLEDMERHFKELKKIRNYMARKKLKNDFDRSFLSAYPDFENDAQIAIEYMNQMGYSKLYRQCVEDGCLCHGAYHQHNIIMGKDRIALVRFDQMRIELQIYDLYVFMRKIMEKNHWNAGLGLAILKTYHRVRPICAAEYGCLYSMLRFPEKYWKIGNRYQNTRKSWMSEHNMEKLDKLRMEQKNREIFLQLMKDYFENL